MPNLLERCCIGGAVPAALACAPILGFRPPSDVLPGRAGEVGAGAVLVSSRPHVDEPLRAAGQTWGGGEVGRTVTITVLGAFDADAVGIGVAARLDALRRDRLAVAVEAEIGYPWLAVSVPVGVRASGESWLYSAPRFGNFGVDPLVTLPLGASVHSGKGVFFRAEGAALVQDLSASGLRWAAGPAVAYQPRVSEAGD